MAADVKTQAFVLRKKISDYPQCSALETATIARHTPKSTNALGEQHQPRAHCMQAGDSAADNDVQNLER